MSPFDLDLAPRIGERARGPSMRSRLPASTSTTCTATIAAEVDRARAGVRQRLRQLERHQPAQDLAHPAGAELLGAKAQQRRHHRELRQREQPADLERRGQREVLAPVGNRRGAAGRPRARAAAACADPCRRRARVGNGTHGPRYQARTASPRRERWPRPMCPVCDHLGQVVGPAAAARACRAWPSAAAARCRAGRRRGPASASRRSRLRWS